MMKEEKREEVKDMGQVDLGDIRVLTIIGEIEGHQVANQNTKTTKYEHLLPILANIEYDTNVKGVIFLVNTVGGDVECGLAIAEFIASLSKPTVSIVLGGSHSIGVPIAVSTDYSYIVPSATMMLHPVRSNGMFIGVLQSYRNIEKIQDRITRFISDHSNVPRKKVEDLMLTVGEQVKDAGTILEGESAVNIGLINEIGGIQDAFSWIQKRK